MLSVPSTLLRSSFIAAMCEFEELVGTADANGLSAADLSWPDRFETYVRRLAEGSLPWQRTHAGARVRCWWWVNDGEFIGRISLRPDLTPGVPHANHIGYAVRPSHRGRGHASAMLAAVLPEAFRLGIDPVILVCTETNTASRKVIGRNGGHLSVIVDGHCHYRIQR
ncbi:GNAT family N-acetyltransferase [Spirillospora sp. CA-128828]|uniref:GNAT family N-acetyltransferase n=1 Tax=Spirillospora sp. CA-128828 TaxID=3240033 RepID=UPI003D948A68